MLLILIVLCTFFSVVTYSEYYPEDVSAANQLAARIVKEFGTKSRVLVVGQGHKSGVEFSQTLRTTLEENGVIVVEVVNGVINAKATLKRLDHEGESLDVIAGTKKTTKDWSIYGNLDSDYPNLKSPSVLQPRSYWWPNFLTSSNLLNVANQVAVYAILAIGMTMVIITGGIDLSVGSLIALSSVVVAMLIRDFAGGTEVTAIGMIACSLIAILTCSLIGMFSGLMHTAFGIPAFIVTLAMMMMARGSAYIIAKNATISPISTDFQWLGIGASFFGIPNAVVLMCLLYLAAHFVMVHTTLGRYIYAVGGNKEAARLSGVPVTSVLLFVYTVCGLLAGLGGIVIASQLDAGSGTFGNTYELVVIAAVVVGGTSISGGEGRIVGTLIGAFIIGVIKNGMNLINVDATHQPVVFGAVILGAVLLDKLKKRLWERFRPSE
jgi:ribose transport system permease protein